MQQTTLAPNYSPFTDPNKLYITCNCLFIIMTSGIQRLKKVEQKQPEEPFLFGKSSKPKMEEHGPSFSAPEDSLQDASGQANTSGKVRIVQ